jgi:hypothetical protein
MRPSSEADKMSVTMVTLHGGHFLIAEVVVPSCTHRSDAFSKSRATPHAP